jgi:hypothetical protein
MLSLAEIDHAFTDAMMTATDDADLIEFSPQRTEAHQAANVVFH